MVVWVVWQTPLLRCRAAAWQSRRRWLSTLSSDQVIEDVRKLMRKIPQPVVVVTTASPPESSDRSRRGITVSSFTSICLHPTPLVSFCVRIPSRASNLLHRSGAMVINMLSHDQVYHSTVFSSPSEHQFNDIPFYDDPKSGQPVLLGTIGTMHCDRFAVHHLGDHELWITRVCRVEHGVGLGRATRPLLYYDRHYRSVGDQLFMRAFEDYRLDLRRGMHQAHVRMAWNSVRDLGMEKATPHIKRAIRLHFEHNPHQRNKYHETITSFYIHLVCLAIQAHQGHQDDFFEFCAAFPLITDPHAVDAYYSPQLLATEDARRHVVPPDLQPLPDKLKPLGDPDRF